MALIQIGTLTPTGNGLLQGGPQGAASFPNALILYQAGDQYGTAVAMPLNPANGRFDLVEQSATSDLYGDLLGYFRAPPGATYVAQGGNSLGGILSVGTNDNNAVEIEVNGTRVMRYEPNPTSPNVLGGHPDNTVSALAYGQTVAGGGSAGNGNSAMAIYATVGGGTGNTASGQYATVAGGTGNIASGNDSAIGGGSLNTATGNFSNISGGGGNIASGLYSTVAGGFGNLASGNYSFAAGTQATTQTSAATPTVHHGVFIFADSSNASFYSAAANEFAVRATGGVRFVSAIDPSTGDPTAGVTLAAGAGSWASLSDRAAKRDFEPVHGEQILDRLAAMPTYEWSYRTEISGARHVGPTAQDFHAAFGLGDSDRTITTIDEGGVALAAIQGLNAKLDLQLQNRNSRIDAQAARIAELEQERAAQAAQMAEQAAEIAVLRQAVDVLQARTAADGAPAHVR